MFAFFKNKDNKNENKNDDQLLFKTTALFIHAAKIDENYTKHERENIKKAIIEFGIKENIADQIIKEAEIEEKNSNQILDFTKEIKSAKKEFKIKIIEVLWRIIYSNKDADMYETNLMRRLTGLLYLDNKLVGDIKEKIKKKLNT
ncbi:MAG: putative conserved protein, tellurite resistance protein B (TerB) family [Pelagibacterales bacterium]|nr:putative conserved protein, tellurite resistance protein B (TerB) family [Pelagibacterales bacterium]